jgi:hypothetical protein
LLNSKIAAEDDQTDENETRLDSFKQKICGLSTLEGEEAKIETSQNLRKIYDDLNLEKNSLQLIEKVVKLVAELAKEEKCRQALVELNFFSPLQNILTWKNGINDLVRTQLCRAIGNLCYYNGKVKTRII